MALRVYVWNAHLCEQFLIPLQFAEICVRNMLNVALTAKFGAKWFNNNSLLSPLPDRLKAEIANAIHEERAQHGAEISSDHIVSRLSFGFWVHLVTRKSIRLIWGGSLPHIFPHMPAVITDDDVFKRVDRLRKFRNRVAHHNAIFDKKPTAEYSNITTIIEWTCPDTLWLARQLSNPPAVINRRPRV